MPEKSRRWSLWRRPPAPPRRSSSTLPVPPPHTVHPPNDPSAPTGSATGLSDDFLDRALALLTSDQQKTIREHTTRGANDIAAVVSRAQNAAVEKRDICIAKQWTINIGGHEIKLRQVADKVITLLDKFKAAGDVASNADPIHAGLPWAGIRMILEVGDHMLRTGLMLTRIKVAVSEHRQMSTLLAGMEIVLYMAKRLQAYLTYLHRVPACLERSGLEDVLVDSYVCILGFLASAIEAFSKGTLARVLGAFFSWDAYTDFQIKCSRLAERTETQASICGRMLDRDGLADVLRQLEKLQICVNIAQVKVDMSRLPVAEGAEFDSYDEQHLAYCYPDTREDLLRHIYAWAEDPDGKAIFWLNGMAGTGKSTISRTVARHWQDAQCLGASFFFKRGEGDRGHARRFFTTLVSQLFQNLPELRRPIADILESSPNIAGKSLQQQFDKLFLDCFERQTPAACAPLIAPPTVLVIDALDECEQSDMTMLLDLLRRGPSSTRLRIFLTSRPELHVQLGFGNIETDQHQDLELHQIADSLIEHDITVLFKIEFDKIRAVHARRHPRYPLPDDWPDRTTLKVLVQRSVPSFIFAVTICRFVADDRGDPVRRLDSVSQQKAVSSHLDLTYMPVLEQLCSNGEDDPEIEEVKWLLGVIAVLEEPLPIASIARLLGLEERDVVRKLSLFHSVLWIPDDPDKPVRLFHLSFRDFLVQEDGTQMRHRFAVSGDDINQRLAIECLNLLGKFLHRDMCRLGEPGCRKESVPQHVIRGAFPPDVSYACRHWTHHLCHTTTALSALVEEAVYAFLQAHLLHWLESLSWLGQSFESLIQITSLLSKVGTGPSGDIQPPFAFTSCPHPRAQSEQTSKLHLFLQDARRFLLANRYIISFAPLQLYASCILFAPDSSVVKSCFQTEILLDLAFLPVMSHEWSSELQRLENSSGLVSIVVFSPDGRTVASASCDYLMGKYTLTLWDVATGRQMLGFDHKHAVTAVAFSPDGHSMLSASYDQAVHIWGVRDGKLRQTFNTPEYIRYASFCPDSKKLAFSGSDTLYILCIATGGIDRIPVGEYLSEVLYSPDGRTIALNFDGCLIRSYRHSRTGCKSEFGRDCGVCLLVPSMAEERAWLALPDIVTSMAFSPDATHLALGCIDNTVILWSVTSAKETFVFKHHLETVCAVAFSPTGNLIASGSRDAMIFVWHMATGEVVHRLEGHGGDINALSFSHDGSLIASASQDGTARIWSANHADTKGMQKGIRCLHNGTDMYDEICTEIVFSLDGSRVLSVDRGIRGLVYETSTAELVNEFVTHPGTDLNARISPDGEYLSTSIRGHVTFNSVASGKVMWERECSKDWFPVIGFSPDSTLAVVGHDHIVDIVCIMTGKVMQREKLSEGPAHVLTMSCDKRMIAGSFEDSGRHAIRCWDLEKRAQVGKLILLDWKADIIALSNDKQYVASTYNNGTIQLWQITTGSELWRLKCQTSIRQMIFSADDLSLITDQGVIHTEQTSMPMIREDFTSIRQNWIRRDGRDIIWLPYTFGEDGLHRVWRDTIGIMIRLHSNLITTIIKFRA